MSLTDKKILVAATGSVATIRLGRLLTTLHQHGANTRLLLTDPARHFTQRADPPLPSNTSIFTDVSDWTRWEHLGDPVLHIELRNWADLLLIAPLSANTLAKLANGLCDNLVTCVARAWPLKHKPFVVAPAMNTEMWAHPFTEEHLAVLRRLGLVIVPPVSKTLACGDVGIGAMESPERIVQVVEDVVAAAAPDR